MGISPSVSSAVWVAGAVAPAGVSGLPRAVQYAPYFCAVRSESAVAIGGVVPAYRS